MTRRGVAGRVGWSMLHARGRSRQHLIVQTRHQEHSSQKHSIGLMLISLLRNFISRCMYLRL